MWTEVFLPGIGKEDSKKSEEQKLKIVLQMVLVMSLPHNKHDSLLLVFAA